MTTTCLFIRRLEHSTPLVTMRFAKCHNGGREGFQSIKTGYSFWLECSAWTRTTFLDPFTSSAWKDTLIRVWNDMRLNTWGQMCPSWVNPSGVQREHTLLLTYATYQLVLSCEQNISGPSIRLHHVCARLMMRSRSVQVDISAGRDLQKIRTQGLHPLQSICWLAFLWHHHTIIIIK